MGEQKPEKTKKHICAGLLAHVYAGVLFREASWIYSRCLGYYQPEKRDAADAGIKGKSRDADGAEK